MPADDPFSGQDIAQFLAHMEIEALDRACPYCHADVSELCRTPRGSAHLARLASHAPSPAPPPVDSND